MNTMWDRGWSWSLRLVLVFAVAAAMWVGAAAVALGALHQRAATGAPPAATRSVSPR